MNKVTLAKIDESNFLDAFHLELGEGQERFVSHPIRSLARPMCTTISVPLSAFMTGIPWWAMSW